MGTAEARDGWKRASAYRAAECLSPGMVVGLGARTTARFAVQRIAELIARGDLADILGIPCSRAVGILAAQLGIPLTTLEAHPIVDVTIDGADEVEPESLAVLKGGGGALLREKIVAQADQDNLILDCDFGPIHEPRALALALSERAGVVEHGLFVALATDLVIADDDGVRHIERTLVPPAQMRTERR